MASADTQQMRKLFQRAPFIAHLGMELESVGPGTCITSLHVEPQHLQQNGFVHAGVLATLADHTAGAAAFTLASPGHYVLTAEFKLSLLRAARGEFLRCQAKVIRSGRRLSFAESEVYCGSEGDEQLVAKASVTLAVVSAGDETAGDPQTVSE